MHRLGLAVLLAGVLMLSLAVPAMAEGERGTIRVTWEPELVDSTLMLHQVGWLEDGGLRLTEEFGGGFVTAKDYRTKEFAAWLEQQKGEGVRKVTDQYGAAMFTELEPGAYLLTQEAVPGYESMAPLLVVLPEEDGSWLAQVSPRMEEKAYLSPETGQPLPPILWSMVMVLSAYAIGIWYENWHRKRRK